MGQEPEQEEQNGTLAPGSERRCRCYQIAVLLRLPCCVWKVMNFSTS